MFFRNPTSSPSHQCEILTSSGKSNRVRWAQLSCQPWKSFKKTKGRHLWEVWNILECRYRYRRLVFLAVWGWPLFIFARLRRFWGHGWDLGLWTWWWQKGTWMFYQEVEPWPDQTAALSFRINRTDLRRDLFHYPFCSTLSFQGQLSIYLFFLANQHKGDDFYHRLQPSFEGHMKRVAGGLWKRLRFDWGHFITLGAFRLRGFIAWRFCMT